MHSFIDDMGAGGTVLCVGLRSLLAPAVPRLLRAAGLDALYVDLEHGQPAPPTLTGTLEAARDAGLAVLARARDAEPASVEAAALLGEDGVIVPGLVSDEQVHSVARVLASVASPTGRRPAFIGMVESAAAVERVDSLLSVRAIDVLFIGMSDLTTSLGRPRDHAHASVRQAVQTCMDAARRHGCISGVGGLGAYPAQLSALARQGARFLSIGSDEDILLRGLRGRVEALKSS